MKTDVYKTQNYAILDEPVVTLTLADAKRLADLYLALAQEYRRLAGLTPVITEARQQKMELRAHR